VSRRRPALLLSLILSASFAAAAPVSSAAAGKAPSATGPRPVVRPAVAYDLSRPLRDMKPVRPKGQRGQDVLDVFRGTIRGAAPPPRGFRDPVRQAGPLGPSSMPAPNVTFEGLKNDDNFPFLVLPPDPNGEVGPNHYVEMVNLVFGVFDRQGNLLAGPFNNNTLWEGHPGICGAFNQGDPIVQYDHLADRWMLSQFAFARDLATGLPVGPYFQCMAISQTSDPTGAYHRYEFKIHDTKLNDYPKYGLWPDAWYASFNLFDQTQLFAFAGAGAAAFERDRMLVGDPTARMVFFDYGTVDTRFGGQLPTDLDGTTLPPAGSPNYFIEADDNTFGFPTDRLSIFEFHVDWTNPASSTFVLATHVDTAPFDTNLCNYERNCIPQKPPGVALDAISDRVMYRAAYRNFGTHEAVVLNHTVDVGDAPDHAGIRWYELRDPGGAPTIHQQGTYAPDAEHRWMGSIAMDKTGNIALGFSLSSSSRFPAIAYAGRLATDPLGTLAQGEAILHAGGGSQTHESGRWGDYSSLVLDPTDDCTLWYTQEYYPVTDGFLWHTRVGSFTFPSCLGEGADLSITKADSPDPVVAGDELTYTVTAINSGPDDAAGATVTDILPAGTTLVSATPSQGSCSGAAVVTCDLGAMSAGSSATITIVVNAPDTAGSITNSATISGPSTDPNPGNNSAAATTNVVNPCSPPGTLVAGDAEDTPPNNPPVDEVDIQTLYVAEPAQADDVARLVFTLNVAPGAATPPNSQWYILWNRPTPDAEFDRNYVAMKSNAAGAVSFEYGKISPPSVNLPTRFGDADDGSYDLDSGAIAISISTDKIDDVGPGSILGGLQARTFFNRPDGGPVTQLQSSDFGEIGSYTMVGNDTCKPDLSVTKTDSPDPVNAGGEVTYTVTVTNEGLTDATGVTLTDTLPSTTTFVSASASQGSCAHSAGTVTCNVGSLDQGASATATIVARTTSAGTITNTASVSSNEGDRDPSDNSASATTTVNAVADLSISLTDAPDPVHVGQSLVYTIVVTNGGPSAATGVGVSQSLPKNTGNASVTTTQGTCSIRKQVVTCSLGSVGVGGAVTIKVTVKPTKKGTLTSTASVTAASPADPNAANNSATVTTRVIP